MSGSTVSITANTANRRRPLVVGDKKQNPELVNDGIISPVVNNNSGGNGVDDKLTGGTNKDLNHSIRGEAVLERSKGTLAQNKKSQLPSSTVSPRRNRKNGPPKPEKPRWQTVLSIFFKNFLLLAVLLCVIQMVRKLVTNSRIEGSGSLTEFTDMEGRIAEVDSSLKTTVKMIMVQLDAVEKKLEGEVWNLRREMNKKIEDKSAELDGALGKLDKRAEILDNALSALRSKDLLTKDDFSRLYDEFQKANGGDLGQTKLTLDDISALARKIVEAEIEKHAADGLGRVDYALASGGATVVKHSEALIVAKGGVHDDAEKMLKPSFGQPGECFPLKGSSGFVEIRLRTAIIPEAITLEHVAKNVAYDRSSAPKHCRVSGWLQDSQVPRGLDNTELALDGEKTFLLAEFSYDLEKSNIQTFNVLDLANTVVINTVRFDFTSNHGSPSFTCIYRLRVHGHIPANSVSVVTATDS
ncbi:hypothetical protein Nepgr_009689 [Nepenthes gracilis]|uniref:SUN domain-containing protein n=1 Tax=Nepenthes gracilis TaxID=150966 RepID=A0AAD3SBV3_NEPGR|nr:hypothetical protein Nepgr_009689 [Nepenthes gracilis]